jgi:hypothetical protein
MRSTSTSIRLRRAIGLIAAYAIALQTILAGLALLGSVALADDGAVICHGAVVDDTSPAPGDGRSGHRGQVGHCALCAISPPVVPLPADVARPVVHPAPVAVIRRVPLALPHDIHDRPGKPRDPPTSA